MKVSARLGALALVGALASGCGGGDSQKKFPSSKAEYIRQADAICADVRSQIESLGNPQDFPALAKASSEAAALSRQGVDRLRALGTPPDPIEAPAQAVIKELDRRRGLVEQLATAARKRDVKAIQKLATSARGTSAATAAVARAAGFKSCGTSPAGQ